MLPLQDGASGVSGEVGKGVTDGARTPPALSAERCANAVELHENLSVGLPHPGFVVGDALPSTECRDDTTCFAEIDPRHVRVEVVLDLVVQPAVEHIDERA